MFGTNTFFRVGQTLWWYLNRLFRIWGWNLNPVVGKVNRRQWCFQTVYKIGSKVLRVVKRMFQDTHSRSRYLSVQCHRSPEWRHSGRNVTAWWPYMTAFKETWSRGWNCYQQEFVDLTNRFCLSKTLKWIVNSLEAHFLHWCHTLTRSTNVSLSWCLVPTRDQGPFHEAILALRLT